MNNLNSVLLEGTLTKKAESHSIGSITLNLESVRKYLVDKKVHIAKTHIEVQADNPKLVEACEKHGRRGRCVRVVGRLDEVKPVVEGMYPLIYIHAEHIEFRPEKPRPERKTKV